jgi:hypothetical protein
MIRSRTMRCSALLTATLLILTLAANATAQGGTTPPPRPALVPCAERPDGPCVVIATSVADIVGVWKQHLGNPMLQAPGGVGYIRIRADGSSSLAPTAEGTAEPYPMYPRAQLSFDGEVMTMEALGDAVPPECRRATMQVQVIRLGAIPVALFYLPIEDTCPGRLADLRVPLIRVAD